MGHARHVARRGVATMAATAGGPLTHVLPVMAAPAHMTVSPDTFVERARARFYVRPGMAVAVVRPGDPGAPLRAVVAAADPAAPGRWRLQLEAGQPHPADPGLLQSAHFTWLSARPTAGSPMAAALPRRPGEPEPRPFRSALPAAAAAAVSARQSADLGYLRCMSTAVLPAWPAAWDPCAACCDALLGPGTAAAAATAAFGDEGFVVLPELLGPEAAGVHSPSTPRPAPWLRRGTACCTVREASY